MTQLLFIPGSLREASSSRATVRALVSRLEAGVTCQVADPGLLPHYNADLDKDPAVERFLADVAAADGVVFVTPEYNYSVPGLLKNAIDWASRPAYNSVFKDKPCFIVSVSGGALGGVRAQAHLKYILNGMLARPFTCQEIVIPQANAKVADGHLADEAILDFAELNLKAFIASL
ncbi:NADPH-dependent FMN reductase [Hoeflea alexandrii]|uniref:NADPH-dependent FMN reductase n=1 Tax=Hoeflea alexandrii TaxID=288436 RepID=UPI0022AED9AF|nr:NADPH-dependent FMN reductase [Hoeflea alexandrii]MCZ4291291.1 NAD(P)H-dependent oxidoreductase [Hoeflea alexandrii]